MKLFFLFVLAGLLCNSGAAPAVIKGKDSHTNAVEEESQKANQVEEPDDWESNLEYGKYLREVINVLEKDPEFRKKLDEADPNDIKTGKIAHNLNFVDHNVRTKLDEVKRREVERLRKYKLQEHEQEMGLDRRMLKMPAHIDHNNPSRFEPRDLEKLIFQLNKDLEKADAKRKEEFKQHELEKEYQYKKKLKEMDTEHRKIEEQNHAADLKKHKDHPKMHHPGTKQQLEEVWEEQDHMEPEDFDPKTFFHLHDLDGNGVWDEFEVKALFKRELDKVYDPNAPEDDMEERNEEMERMREHVFGETDKNKDNLISLDEFMDQAHNREFDRDEGWDGIEDEEFYSPDEFEEYQRRRDAEFGHLEEDDEIPPPPGYKGINPPQPDNLNGIPSHPNAIHHGVYEPQHGYPSHPQSYQQSQGFQGQPLPSNYQAAPHNYQIPPQNYQIPPQNYQIPSQNYQIPPQNYQIPPQSYQNPSQNYQIPQQNYQIPQGNQVPLQNYQALPPMNNLPPPNQQFPQANVVSQANQMPQQSNQVPLQNHQALPHPNNLPPPNQQFPQNSAAASQGINAPSSTSKKKSDSDSEHPGDEDLNNLHHVQDSEKHKESSKMDSLHQKDSPSVNSNQIHQDIKSKQ